MARHVVIAPDKFKGSLTAAEAAHAISVGLKRGDPTLTTVQCPVAGGGDGTLGTVLAAGFERIPVYAKGPTGQIVQTAYGRSGKTAVVEMAEICGLQRLPGGVPAPMTASSHGLGAVVGQALDHGCRDIIVGHRVDAKDELRGLDIPEMGALCYPDFVLKPEPGMEPSMAAGD